MQASDLVIKPPSRKPPGPISKFIVGRLIPLCLIIGGIGVIIGGSLEYARAAEVARWPATEGRIEGLEQKESPGSDGFFVIAYSYSVDYEKYSGEYTETEIEDYRAIMNRHPDKRKVDVFYNPADPSISVLKTTPDIETKLTPIIGLAFSLVGGLMFIFIPRWLP